MQLLIMLFVWVFLQCCITNNLQDIYAGSKHMEQVKISSVGEF